jgi:hypothetical protein
METSELVFLKMGGTSSTLFPTGTATRRKQRAAQSVQCLQRKVELRKNARPHPSPLPQERETRRPTLHTLPISVAVGATLRFVSEAVPPLDAFVLATRGRTIHPLLRERAGVRASVPLTFTSPSYLVWQSAEFCVCV